MATYAGQSHGFGVRHGPSNSTSSHPSIPGSPTLTNPDMILPDYDSPDERSQSPLGWDITSSGQLHYQLPPRDAFIAGPMIPTTPIIYGNGTMLSDIGEVTEVESVVGASRRASSHFSNHNAGIPLHSSPTIGMAIGGTRIKSRSLLKTRPRTSSIDSNSTITTQEHDGVFADFDDGGSVDDLDFQGDDEESMASEYVEGTPAQEPAPGPRPEKRVNENRFSTNSLSEKAEQILANAKQRLTTMEGNLSRARNTPYYSIMSDGSTPSPPAVRPATSLRESTLPPSNHARMMSENGLQGGPLPTGFPQRSASALGAAGGYRQPLTSSRSADALGGVYAGGHKFSHQPLDTTLESPGEDDVQSDVDNRPSNSYLPDVRSPTFDSPLEKELTRSASVAQVRDLKDQMKDLKGKISSLKEQARVDSMKRRSLQSLRTPSPFTHARWDQNYMEQKKEETTQNGSPLLQESWNQDEPSPVLDQTVPRYGPDGALELEEIGFQDARQSSDQDEMGIGLGVSHPEPSDDRRPAYDDEDLLTEDGEEDQDDDAFQDAQQEEDFQDADYEPEGDEQGEDEEDYVSDSGDSLYHDTFQHPVSHEDREDAFDYEHFFLHSAMGSMSRQRYGRRGSASSISSEESVETTKGPYLTRERRPSTDTMSSVDTFATAHDGRASRVSAMKNDIRETVLTPREDFDGPPSSRRSTFDGSSYSRSANSSGYFQPTHYRGSPAIHRSTHSTSVIPTHRPSVSSFESTGTNRSFPLVSKTKLNGGVLTPGGTPGSTPRSTPRSTPGGSPDHELKRVSQNLLNDATNVAERNTETSSRDSPTIHLLSKEDQILVERLVASLGKCVLGLSEASKASSEARTYRRRIDRARKILEGMED